MFAARTADVDVRESLLARLADARAQTDALLDVVTASGTLLHVRGAVTIRRGDHVHVRVPPERALVYPVD